ncbi:MAG TPA: DUF2934 domain-containing protein [Candidatus Angelobacter sp.]|nr:DUF2934 domain-containing protein [Candidatus Angelobacter sp.]
MTESSSTPTHEQIARRAYEIFVERGQPEGKDLDHWLEAESQLRAAAQPSRSSQTASSQSASSSSPIRSAQMTAPSNGRTQSSGRPQARAGARK